MMGNESSYNKIHKIRLSVGNLLDEAGGRLDDDTSTPQIKRDAQFLLDALYPIHEALYQVEKQLQRE